MGTGEALKAAGMNRAAEAQEADEEGWGDRALAVVRRVAEDNEFVWSDLVRERFTEEPKHPNAWGAVWRKARKLGWLTEELGLRRPNSSRPPAHAAKQTVYRSTIWHGW
ncbi:MAG TPA: hypothetical protein VGV07_18000 [Devosia sp.]|jgi:hypothetical protein|uniref:hypothetical protein n=1 Tax=Devosia sp. TaxID=1871048 RepID=UPI002DDD62FD|nr:hypothetical protein [Devosia sp.]HEV2517152.1 hypothetical protein [Devosia sp.]